jgi:general secretion pathway protein B
MSYILDALKKSEQQRHRGAAPSLLAAQVADAPPRRPAVLLYGLAAAALLVAGVAIGILRPWQAQAPAVQPVAVKPPEAAAPPAPPPLAPPTPTPAPDRAPASVAITINAERPSPAPPMPALAPAAPPAPAPASDVPRAQGPAPAAPVQAIPSRPATAPESRVPSPASGAPSGGRPADPAPERAPMTLAELPPSVQQELPKLAILFHLYSGNPRDRLVGINDRMLREGDAVEPGLVLEQITPDGMILTYKGYRFQRGSR